MNPSNDVVDGPPRPGRANEVVVGNTIGPGAGLLLLLNLESNGPCHLEAMVHVVYGASGGARVGLREGAPSVSHP